jgi:hypothetical protein
VALAEPVRLGDYAVVDAGCNAIGPVIRSQRWMLIVIGAKDSTGALDSTASVGFGAPDQRPQIKVPERGRYRIRMNVIDAEKANLTRPLGHHDQHARSDCVITCVIDDQPTCESTRTPSPSVINSQHERGKSTPRCMRRDESGGDVVVLKRRRRWSRDSTTLLRSQPDDLALKGQMTVVTHTRIIACASAPVEYRHDERTPSRRSRADACTRLGAAYRSIGWGRLGLGRADRSACQCVRRMQVVQHHAERGGRAGHR